MNHTRKIGIGVLAAAGSLVLAACGGGSEGTSGAVSVDGSSTVGPLTSVAAELFQQEDSNVNVTVGTSGTGGGFDKLCRGEIDMADASRPIEDDEAANCASADISYASLSIANDALTVVVNKENTWAKCLTTQQLKKIWEPDSNVTNWNQVDPSYPDEALALFGPGTDSGTFDYFTAEITGEEGASRTDYTPSEDDNVIVQGVTGTPGGMGYFGFTYYQENSDTLNAVEIDSGDGCVMPSADTVQDGSYTPLGRPLFIYPSLQALAGNSAFADFLEFYVNNDAQIATDAQFIPLSAAQVTQLQADYQDALSEAAVAPSDSPS